VIVIFFLCEKIVIFLCGSIVMELVQGGSLFQIDFFFNSRCTRAL